MTFRSKAAGLERDQFIILYYYYYYNNTYTTHYSLRHNPIAVRRVELPAAGQDGSGNGMNQGSTGHKFLPQLLISGRTGEWPGRMPAWRRYRGPPCPDCHMSPQLTECRTSPTLGISDHLSGAYGPQLQGLPHQPDDTIRSRWQSRVVK